MRLPSLSRQRAAPYAETLEITVHSEIAHIQRTMQVLLGVQAQTSFSVWGRVAPESGVVCKDAPADSLLADSTVGVLQRVPFTACDIDALPVAHTLPTQSDPRRFYATLLAFGRTEETPLPVEYLSAGTYNISVVVLRHGPFRIRLRLGSQLTELSWNVTCPSNRVALLGGR